MKKFINYFMAIAIFMCCGIILFACNKKEYSITVQECEHGEIFVDNSARAGEEVYFDAQPETGYTLTKITYNNRVIEGDHFTMPEKDVVLRATFTKSFEITINNTQNGTVTVGNQTYTGGDKIYLSISPASGYKLKHLDANVSINMEFNIGEELKYYFIMPNFDVQITPVFERIYTISVAPDIAHGYISVLNEAFAGDQVEIMVIPDENYAIKTLSINGTNYFPANNTFSFTMPNTNVLISAEFETAQTDTFYNVNVIQANNGTIAVNKTTAKFGDTIVVTLTPSNGFKVKHILINNTPTVIENNVFSFLMPNFEITISAVFENAIISDSFNAISMVHVDDNSSYDEIYYKNNFINIEENKFKCGYYDGEKYCVHTLNYQILNNQIILQTTAPFLSELTITIESGRLIVGNDDVSLTYERVEDFDMPHGVYTSPETISDQTIQFEYVFQSNGNIISIADVQNHVSGDEIGKANIYGNIMIIENVNYDISNYEVYVGKLSKLQQSYIWDFYNFYYTDDYYQYFHDPKTFTYKNDFDETTYTYNNETLSGYLPEKDKFIRITGNLVTFGAYIYETLEDYGTYEGFLYLEYLPATIDGNNISVQVPIPFSEQSCIVTINATLSQDKQTLTVNFMDEEIIFTLTENIEFSSGTYQRTEVLSGSATNLITDVIDEDGNVTERVTYQDVTTDSEYIGRFKVFGNICVLLGVDESFGIFVGKGQISSNVATWSGINFYVERSTQEFTTDEFHFNYNKIA